MHHFFAAVILLIAPSLALGNFYVSGDSNNLLGIDGSYGSLPNGNAQFFKNLLGGDKSVAIYDGMYGSGTANILNNLYNSVSGVQSTLRSGTIMSLTGVDLLVIDLPDSALSTTEAALVRNFQATGGDVFLVGENSTISNASVLNTDLAAFGSSLRVASTVSDGGVNYATIANGQILTDALTAGVDRYVYGGLGISFVTGGKAVLLSQDHSDSLFSVERPAIGTVPEPSTLLLTVLGISTLIIFRRN